MSFTMGALVDALRGQGRDVSDGDGALAFVQIDQAALRAVHEQRVRWERWEGQPIGSATATDIRARSDYGGGEIYLVYLDDHLVFLQPHDPEATGYDAITADELSGVAGRHCDRLVDELTFEAAVEMAVGTLPKPAPVAPVRDPFVFDPMRPVRPNA